MPLGGMGFDRRRTVGLLGVSLLVVAAVLYNRAESRQVRVEARAESIRELAEEEKVAPELLLALCIAEAYRGEPRSDSAVAKRLAEALEDSRGVEEDAVHSLFGDRVEARMALELWARNHERWQRIMGRNAASRDHE